MLAKFRKRVGRQIEQIDKFSPSLRRHAIGFMELEPMMRDLERYATLLGDYIDEQDKEKSKIRVMLGFRVQAMCTELKNEYYRLWGPCALPVKRKQST
ncbi:MAG TPA: hypothetical protein VFI94_13850 [Pseudolabrys sp.]|nr:hypothetical protein [Pseudolabrys sp.]